MITSAPNANGTELVFSWLEKKLFPTYASPPKPPGLRRVSRLVIPDDVKWEQSPDVQLDCWVQLLCGPRLEWQIGNPMYHPTLEEIAKTGLVASVLPNPRYQCGVYDYSEEYLFVRRGEEVPVWGWHSSVSWGLVQECIGKRRGQSVTVSGSKGEETFKITGVFRLQVPTFIRASEYGWGQCRRADRFRSST